MSSGPDRRRFALSAVARMMAPLGGALAAPLLARGLGPEGRGVLASVLASSQVVGFVVARGAGDRLELLAARGQALRSIVHTVAIRVALVGALAGAALGATVSIASHDAGWLVLLAVPAVTVVAVNVLHAAVITGEGAIAQLAVARMSGATLRLVLLGLLVCADVLSVGSALGASLAAIGIEAWLSRRVSGSRGPRVHLWKRSTAREPVVERTLAGILFVTVRRMDVVLLTIFGLSSELGLYVVAASYAELSGQLVDAFRDSIASRVLAAEAGESRRIRIGITLSVVASATAALAGPLLIPLVFGEAFDRSVVVAIILCAGSVPMAVFRLLDMAAVREGLHRRRAVAFGGAMVVQLVLFLALGADARAMAVGSACSYVVPAASFISSGRRGPIESTPHREALPQGPA